MQPNKRAAVYARQRNTRTHGINGVVKATPKQRKRLQKKYTRWLKGVINPYEAIPCSNHDTHKPHLWEHPEYGTVDCLGVGDTNVLSNSLLSETPKTEE